jgi:hypothetical protein
MAYSNPITSRATPECGVCEAGNPACPSHELISLNAADSVARFNPSTLAWRAVVRQLSDDGGNALTIQRFNALTEMPPPCLISRSGVFEIVLNQEARQSGIRCGFQNSAVSLSRCNDVTM